MYDHSFNKKTISKLFRPKDAKKIPALEKEEFKFNQISLALTAARSNFAGANPLRQFLLKGKDVYKFIRLADELASRKITQNLKFKNSEKRSGRAAIVANLALLLEEGTPYRLYRLDVRRFYESFEAANVNEKVRTLINCSPHCKKLLTSLLEHFSLMGGTGVPRGLALSAALSDILMSGFDKTMRSFSDTYFYARYVDDIILLTSANEIQTSFEKEIKASLPPGLYLNNDKKTVGTISERVFPKKASKDIAQLLKFDYLGYEFKITDPLQIPGDKRRPSQYNRAVAVDIAASKVKKIKTRIAKSFIDYQNNQDWKLLVDRIKFLTENFSVFNQNSMGRRLAGIYHSYPQVPSTSPALRNLDHFLKNAVLAKSGRIFLKTPVLFTQQQRRILLGRSFQRGHAERTFVHFSGERISQIQECWNK